ncbi:LysR family transcriptional regulator [Amphritea sp. HPY]|uniref:LysR family transcriptional regulator n=1 Tax=Amphritea sp. HPY TaxID=3421652 RepID=UPI003D7ED381
MDKLNAMHLYVRVVDTGSFSAVATEHGYSQSTVSKQIAGLEEALGVRLLQRTTRQLKMTEAGLQYYNGAQILLQDLQLLEASTLEKVQSPGGLLRINTPVSFGRCHIVPLLPDFLAEYPDIRIEHIQDARRIDLVSEGIDLAIRIGELADSSLISRKLGLSTRTLVCSKAYLKQNGPIDHHHHLQQLQCLLYSQDDVQRYWHFSTADGPVKLRVTGNYAVNNIDSLLSAVLNHMGIALLPHWLVRSYIDSGELTEILPDYCARSVSISALYPQNIQQPTKVRCFIDFLIDQYKNNPDLN